MKECAAEAARVVRAVPQDRLSGPTPCADFDLRTLVNHLVLYTSHGLEHRALRKDLPDDLTEHDFTADADWQQDYAAQLDRGVAAWADPAVWDGEINGMAAPDIAAMLTLEMALHGWDVAKSVGEDYRLSPEAGAFILQTVNQLAEMYRQYDGFAAALPTTDDTPAFTQALAASGRDPGWRAPA